MEEHAERPRLYRYVIVADGGDAPCTQDGLVTLGTCKPIIRRLARVGDWIAACRGQARHNGSMSGALVWAGQINEKVGWDDYVSRFPDRFDARYSTRPFSNDLGESSELHGWFRKKGPYHDDARQQGRDIKQPVLLFEKTRTWYFGADPKPLARELSCLVPTNQGHRVNHPEQLTHDFINWLAGFSPGVTGSHPDADFDWDRSNCEPVYRPPHRS